MPLDVSSDVLQIVQRVCDKALNGVSSVGGFKALRGWILLRVLHRWIVYHASILCICIQALVNPASVDSVISRCAWILLTCIQWWILAHSSDLAHASNARARAAAAAGQMAQWPSWPAIGRLKSVVDGAAARSCAVLELCVPSFAQERSAHNTDSVMMDDDRGDAIFALSGVAWHRR